MQQFWNDGTCPMYNLVHLSHAFAQSQKAGFFFLDLTGERLSLCLATGKQTEDNVLCGEGASLDGHSSMETVYVECIAAAAKAAIAMINDHTPTHYAHTLTFSPQFQWGHYVFLILSCLHSLPNCRIQSQCGIALGFREGVVALKFVTKSVTSVVNELCVVQRLHVEQCRCT
jgi:hypothetical protein